MRSWRQHRRLVQWTSRKFSSFQPQIIVGMSGGVDSSVTAALLKEQGFSVLGVFMNNWDEKDEYGECQGERDWKDVQAVGAALDVPVERVDLSREYWNSVFQPFLAEYEAGRTPNPDIWCNRYVKFGAFQDYCKEKFGVQRMATGHYCRLQENADGRVSLLRGVDPSKDQSYFLSQVKQENLQNSWFPLGSYYKQEIRQMASQLNLPVATKKDSVGICYIGKRDFPQFISNYITPHPGPILDHKGTVVGRHSGIHQWTVGQRIRLPGLAEPLYVYKIDDLALYVCPKNSHHLYSNEMYVTALHWIGDPLPALTEVEVQVRYHGLPYKAQLTSVAADWALVKLDEPAICSPGQIAAIYLGDICCGSAVISKTRLFPPASSQKQQQ